MKKVEKVYIVSIENPKGFAGRKFRMLKSFISEKTACEYMDKYIEEHEGDEGFDENWIRLDIVDLIK